MMVERGAIGWIEGAGTGKGGACNSSRRMTRTNGYESREEKKTSRCTAAMARLMVERW
jgi:hypothetical protein